MTFREAVRKEREQRKWIYRSKKLFRKYSQLDLFDYKWDFYVSDFIPVDWWGEEHIIVGEGHDEPKTYYVANTKEGYERLKQSLELELKIRYK